MINFEWLRTFRTVYKTESLTKAADILLITQPAVSQHIAALEAQAGQKLFVRKSKGVAPTAYARTLNNMIASSLDDLAEVESLFQKRSMKRKAVVNIGISEHMYNAVLAGALNVIDYNIHVSHGSAEKLIKETGQGDLNYAIVPEVVTNFDTDCHPFSKQYLMLVHTPDIDLSEFEQLFSSDLKKAEKWLSKQRWYSHKAIMPFIKQFWMDVFDKKRPENVPFRVIPNESEVLVQLAKGTGFAVCFDNVVKSYLEEGSLIQSKISAGVTRKLFLLVNRKKNNKKLTTQLLSLISKA